MPTSDIKKGPLYVDSTNNRVGIGTSSPQRHLHINDSSAVTTKIQITNSATGSGSDGDGFQLGIGSTGQANIEQRENQPLTFSTNNTERMRIDSSGRVGIGTSSNNYGKFTVQNTAGTGKVLLDSYQSVPTTENVMAIHADASNGYIESYNNGYKNIIIARSGGNVGIANSSPTSKLTVGSSSIAAGTGLFQQIQTAGNNMYVGIGSNNSAYIQANGEFRIATGGYADKVTVDSSGNVGIGTNSPNANLHTQASSTNIVSMQVQNTEGTGSRLDMYAFGSSPAIQSAHRAAVYQWTGAGIDLWTRTGDLHFGTNNTERMRIDSSGNLLVGTTSPYSQGERLAVSYPYLSGTGIVIDSGAGGGAAMRFRTNSTLVGSIITTTSSTGYNTSSDYRLKTAVTYDWDATTRLKQLRPTRFEWIADGDDAVPVDGFLAHEVQDVVPEAITGTHNEVDDDGNPVYQGIDQSKLTPLLTKALIEAVEKIEQLETRIAALEAN